MKYFALTLALSSAISAAEFRTGQAARAVIGQQTFTQQEYGTSASTVGAVGGVAYANDTLFVADSSRTPALPQNHRALIYRGISEKIPGPKESSRNWEVRCPVCRATADTVLGQPDFSKSDLGLAQNRFRTPTAIATDGQRLAVADTDNNRVLLWNSIPTSNEAPADIVLGQKDFTTGMVNYAGSGNSPSPNGLRGPQGVWIQGTRVFVADTLNNRVLVWNSFPTQNAQAADLVLGAPNFTTFVQPDLSQLAVSASATSLLNPVAVTSDGVRLIVTDLGHNRVVVWNSLPTQNTQPGDFVLGQPSIESSPTLNASNPNNTQLLCRPVTDAAGTATYPYACAATLSFPRYALSDGTRLFIADGGNDRVLVYHTMPTFSGQPADAVLGQVDESVGSDSDPFRVSAADTLRTPTSLAWDGTNLYVTDPFNRRVMVFSMSDELLPLTSVRNSASREIYASGSISFTADPKENDEITVKIANTREYKYKAVANDRIGNVVVALVLAINAGTGDPDVIATGNPLFGQILLNARAPGDVGNNIAIAVSFSTGAQIQGSAATATLIGGKDTAKVAPGTLVTILGENLARTTEFADLNGNDLPHSLGGIEVYVDGLAAPLLFVSRNQINTQLPYEVNGSSGVSLWVRIQDPNGNVRITNPIGVPVVQQNPGIFALDGADPRQAVATHASNNAAGVVSVDGSAKENDTVSIIFGEENDPASRTYSYTTKKDDNLASIRDGLIAAINNADDAEVSATPGGVYNRVFLQSKTRGPEGEGLRYRTVSSENTFLTPYGERLCCASEDGALITEENPARPGELITVYTTGLGLVLPDAAKFATVTGSKYHGPLFNYTNVPVDDAIVGGKTANVIFAGLKYDAIGIYEVKLLLNSDIPTNAETQVIIAQDIFVSNVVTIAVVNPNAP